MWKENIESIIEDLKAYEGLTKEQLLTLFIQQKLSVNTTNYVEELENDSSLTFQQLAEARYHDPVYMSQGWKAAKAYATRRLEEIQNKQTKKKEKKKNECK